MQEMFNHIMNKIEKRQGPIQPGAAALYHFPEVFQKLRDEYMHALLMKLVSDETS